MRTRSLSFPIAIATFFLGCDGSPTTGGSHGRGTDVAPSTPPAPPPSPSTPPGDPTSTPAGAPTTPPPPPPKVVVTNETLEVAGKTRDFVLAVPRVIVPGKAYPLVLVLHGDGGDGVSMRSAMPFDDVTGDAAVVAYPSGTSSSWRLYQPPAENPDLAFIVGLVGSLVTRLGVDATRVFATGFSSGAFMANQIACREPALLRAIASHGGGAPAEPEDPNASTWPSGYVRCANQTSGVAALIVHGMEDTTVPYGSAIHEAKYWTSLNGCATTRTPAQPALPAPCETYDECPTDKPVAFCGIPGLGHGAWSEARAATWAFFRSF